MKRSVVNLKPGEIEPGKKPRLRSDISMGGLKSPDPMDVDANATDRHDSLSHTQNGFTSLHEALDKLVDKYGDCPAVEDDNGTSWTYAELHAAEIRISSSLLTVLASGGQDAGVHQAGPVVAVLMHRTCSWVAACIAAARLNCPLVALSGDLGNSAEEQRTADVLKDHRPPVMLLHSALRASAAAAPALVAESDGWLRIVDADAVLREAEPLAMIPQPTFRSADDVLYWCYTGGTTSASKCAATTHRMALFELEVYPNVAPLQQTDRVLQQSSAYWGATALGIFDLAWCCGACLVLSVAGSGPTQVARVIEERGVTVAGVVPSVLDALEEDKCQALRLIFTWGEALNPRTASRWLSRASVFDLLIATEYWLILYAEHSLRCQSGFRPVPGAQLTLVRPESENAMISEESSELAVPVPEGEIGELFLGGPMISAVGYKDAWRNEDAFVLLPIGHNGKLIRHFRTRDLARKRPDGTLEYCGRADGFAKVGGKWIDLAAVERQLTDHGCEKAALLWDPHAKKRHAAVALKSTTPPTQSLAEISAELLRVLPKDTSLHVLKDLPHNMNTGKINRAELLQRVAAATCRPGKKSISRACFQVRKSLLVGLVLAARAGARGPVMVPIAWNLAPGLLSATGASTSALLDDIPQGLGWHVKTWATWYRALDNILTSSQLVALPYIALLLYDCAFTGLAGFERMMRNPFGTFGTAVLVCRTSPPLFRSILALAGKRHAEKRRGGTNWEWAFWLGLTSNADEWFGSQFKRPSNAQETAEAISAMWNLIDTGTQKMESVDKLPFVSPCYYCSTWTGLGEMWQGCFYCVPCTNAYFEHKQKQAEEKTTQQLSEEAAGIDAGTVTAISVQVDTKPLDTQTDSISPVVQKCLVNDQINATDVEKESSVASTPLASSRNCSSTQSGAGFNDTPRSQSFSDLPNQSFSDLPNGHQRCEADEIDFAEYEVAIARRRAPQRTQLAEKTQSNQNSTLSNVARVVERVAGIDGSNQEASLTSLESLKIIALVSALRRDLKLDLSAIDVSRCSTLRELEQTCAITATTVGKPPEQPSSGREEEEGWAIYAIPRFWKAPVGWLIRLHDMPNEIAMWAACRALVRRHAALRAQAYACYGDEHVAQTCNSAAPILETMRNLLGDRGRAFCDEATHGLLAAWPRVMCTPDAGLGPEEGGCGIRPEEVAHFEWRRFKTEAELRSVAWLKARSRGFKLPASISCLIVDSEGCDNDGKIAREKQAAFLHVAVNHAVTDAASIVPLVVDLLELHKAAKAALATFGDVCLNSENDSPAHAQIEALAEIALATASIPPAPNGMAAQQERLRLGLLGSHVYTNDLSGTDDGSRPDEKGALDLTHTAFSPRRPGGDHYVRLKPTACRVLEVASKVLGVPTDHLLVVVIAFAASQVLKTNVVKLSLIAPMRDGKGEGQVVANMATTRHLSLFVGGGRPMSACALDLSGRLRRREWDLCDVLGDDGDRVYINIRSIPKLDGATPDIELVNTTRAPTNSVRNCLEMFADQETPEQWTLWMGIEEHLDGKCFSSSMRKAIWALATTPLQPMPGSENIDPAA